MLLQQKLIYPLACSTFSLWEMGCMGKQSIPEATAHIIGSITRSDEGMWSLPTSLMDFYSACHFLSGVLSKYAALREVFFVWARQHSPQDQKEIIDVYSRATDFMTRAFVPTTTHIYFARCGCCPSQCYHMNFQKVHLTLSLPLGGGGGVGGGRHLHPKS